MKNSLPYQFVADLVSASEKFNFPSLLKKIIKEKDISDVEKLEKFFDSELTNASFQNQSEIDYFLFIADQTIRYFFLKRNAADFQETLEKIKHRMLALRNVQGEVNLRAWEVTIEFLEHAYLRLVKHSTIEAFEKKIDEIEWSVLDRSFIASLSMVIGYVYKDESDPVQAGKSRMWLQKSINENRDPNNLGNYLLLANYYFQTQSPEMEDQIHSIIEKISSLDISEDLDSIFSSAVFELEAELSKAKVANFDDVQTQQAHCEKQIEALHSRFQSTKDSLPLPSFAQHSIAQILAGLKARLFQLSGEKYDKANPPAFISDMDSLLDKVSETNDFSSELFYRLSKAELVAESGLSLPEKEIKEASQIFRNNRDYPSYIKTQSIYSKLHINNDQPSKCYDVIISTLKQGEKRIEEGGFFLITKGMEIANDVFIAETQKPGISWMVEKLDAFFGQIAAVIDNLDNYIDLAGKSLTQAFMSEYLRFESVSHFNIKTYFRFQLYQVKILRIGSMLHNDQVSLAIANSLVNRLEDKNNPISFIKADWDDYKKVPNSVRNKTLNQTINISKGDLPLAAEHLDFSYRNLRSYITFKEVNRLGFFLDLQQTNNRQLEQGIRYMFYDLYKSGTIFEVVFDMPKFLVNHAKSGFFSQDMEVSLNIKGTTAKKYIKIMIEIGLIRQDKTMGRKHFYHLNVDKAMKRLGRDQNTLIKSEG